MKLGHNVPRLAALGVVVVAIVVVVLVASSTRKTPRPDPGGLQPLVVGQETSLSVAWPLSQPETPCVYSSEHISVLNSFGALVGRSFQCAMVYNDAAPDWASWVKPWFLSQSTSPDLEWAKWATARGTHRELVITQNLFPSSENGANWLQLGASGAFSGYARSLAANLVRSGLGWSVIRLAHEANGTWAPYSIPNTPQGDALWIRFWRKTALAMRSVPGAHFLFDWTVNAGYRRVPLASFYPGNDVVDIIGVDAYDAGVSGTGNRWKRIYDQPDGLRAVAAFARAHGKPMSIPEWGLAPGQQPGKGQGGDDPAYVNGIANVVAHDNVLYQSYFDSDIYGVQLQNSPRSLAAFIRRFGAEGDAVTPALRSSHQRVGSLAPALVITGGPGYGSTVSGTSVTFTFDTKPGVTAECSLDDAPFTPCTTSTGDVLSNLSPGYHAWLVQVHDAADRESTQGRAFVVSAP
jgi:hypothetical protein